jgi:two-component system, OmpR family, sensor histidine kinase MprB
VSLRRRIAGAAALAVAAVAVTMGVTGYLSTRSHLLGELRKELHQRAEPYLRPHGNGFPGASNPGASGAGSGEKAPPPASPGTELGGAPVGTGRSGGWGGSRGSGAPVGDSMPRMSVPPAPPLGGAPGYFQFVRPDGTAVAEGGATPVLPVDARVIDVARRARGSFFASARVHGVHLEVLTIGDPYDHYAVQVALPLTGVDSVLSGLLLTYGLLIGGGVLLAALLGAAISTSALAPIERFLGRTELVTRSLSRPGRPPERLEEHGASELRRLAVSFNRTLDALERSIDAQRQLIADASHELRTPISALRSDIQIFLDSERLPEHERSGLQLSIMAELDELTQIVADVVELARGPSLDGRLEPIELDLLVREAVDRAERRAPLMKWDVELDPTEIVNVSDRVSRAVANVIDNARKWSEPGSEIEVRLRNGTLSIRDHGPGFDAHDLPRVFERFYRADSARGKPGSGLGLAIVRQAAEAYGGSAQAANAPGGGAVVSVSFGPRSPGAPTQAEAPKTGAMPTGA